MTPHVPQRCSVRAVPETCPPGEGGFFLAARLHVTRQPPEAREGACDRERRGEHGGASGP